jgi:hypothetical protein
VNRPTAASPFITNFSIEGLKPDTRVTEVPEHNWRRVHVLPRADATLAKPALALSWTPCILLSSSIRNPPVWLNCMSRRRTEMTCPPSRACASPPRRE